MVITIHQPEHLPWLGFFDKVRQADVFVLLDHVQYRKNYFQNRNRIRSDAGALWLTVPVLTKGHLSQAINQVRINNEGGARWQEKCWGSLVQYYRNARYWRAYEPFFHHLYTTEWNRLVDINEHIIHYLLSTFSIKTKVLRSSEMNVEGHRSKLLLNICQKLGAHSYLSGVSGREYLELSLFSDVGIEVRFHEFRHPIYTQVYEPFLPCMSAVDLLFNHGPDSLDIIKGVGVKTMDRLFA